MWLWYAYHCSLVTVSICMVSSTVLVNRSNSEVRGAPWSSFNGSASSTLPRHMYSHVNSSCRYSTSFSNTLLLFSLELLFETFDIRGRAATNMLGKFVPVGLSNHLVRLSVNPDFSDRDCHTYSALHEEIEQCLVQWCDC